MRIVIEIDMDNHAAMFNRSLFEKQVHERLVPKIKEVFPQGVSRLETEDTE